MKKNSGWHKIEAGLYVKRVGTVEFEVEYDAEVRAWHCRRNDQIFDTAETLREAKTYCVEPEGKPLIEIL